MMRNIYVAHSTCCNTRCAIHVVQVPFFMCCKLCGALRGAVYLRRTKEIPLEVKTAILGN
eukprot:3524249-Pyramimonas_sp.AAC.1